MPKPNKYGHSARVVSTEGGIQVRQIGGIETEPSIKKVEEGWTDSKVLNISYFRKQEKK